MEIAFVATSGSNDYPDFAILLDKVELVRSLVVNPSFEADPRPPGNGDGPITGWPVTSGPGGASGINTVTGPLADNGVIPDGEKVAFLYGANTMRQTVSGFTVGTQYVLRYYENARDCCAPRTANLQVTVGGVTVVPTHEVRAVGGTNPYIQKTSAPFTATAANLDVAFITSGSGDFTVLLDQVEFARAVVVTNNADSGAGSLRQTVLEAPPASVITFSEAVRGTISLTTGKINIYKDLTIQGPGADTLGRSPRRFRRVQQCDGDHLRFN